ncbi:MAG: hypothetical protein ABJI33_08960 [Balneola sp.]
MSCSKEISQFEKVPDSWFTIEPTLIGVDDYNPCYELFVIENLDQYSIGRENKCIVPPRILKEEERGDIIIQYKLPFSGTINIHLRRIDSNYRAFLYKYDSGALDVIGDSKWYSTIDSLESLKFLEGPEYKKIEVEELVIDFNRDFLKREFFDSIKVEYHFPQKK